MSDDHFDEKELEAAENFYMGFGKYHGKRLKDIPTGYLRWAAEKLNEHIAPKADLIVRWRKRFNIEVD